MKVIKWFLYFIAVWFVIHAICITIDGLNDDNIKAEYAVVLGNTVNPDGTLSERLRSRVDAGLELYRKAKVKKIIVSGGLGKEGRYEGTAMKEYMVQNGVSESNIIVDDYGNTTRLTALNVGVMIDKNSSVIVVTQYHHISRCKLAFHKAGFKNVYGVHGIYFEWRDIYSIAREFFGYYKYLFFF